MEKEEFKLSENLLSIRRYLWSPQGMEWGHKDNRGIYVDLGSVIGNVKELKNKETEKEKNAEICIKIPNSHFNKNGQTN